MHGIAIAGAVPNDLHTDQTQNGHHCTAALRLSLQPLINNMLNACVLQLGAFWVLHLASLRATCCVS